MRPTWSGGYQKVIFPDCVSINSATRQFRTPRVNECVALILNESRSCKDENNGGQVEPLVLSGGAERVGFEPTVQLPAQQFSRLSHSATLAPLLKDSQN